MTFDQFFRILRARWLLALSIVVVLVALTLTITLLIPKSYRATALVMADMKPDPVTGMSGMMGAQLTGLIATQIDLIKSPAVSMRVVRTLRIDESGEMRQQWQSATGGKGDYTAWVADLISQNLNAKPSRESNIIEIEYTSVDPKFAAAMANAYAKAYMDSSVQIRVDPARQYYSFFEERAQLARERLEAAQMKLAAAQREKGIVVTDERLDAENTRLNELSSQLASLQAMGADSSSRSAAAQRNPEQMADIINNPLISNLKAEQARSEARLDELTARLGDAHPNVIEARATLESLRSRLATETSRVSRSLGINNSISSSREAEVRAAYEEQRSKMLKMKDARTELSVLEREVDSAQRIFEAIQLRLSQMGLESSNTQNNIVLVAAATEPARHYFPRITLALLLAMSVGSLLSVLITLGVELFDRRIRGPQDLLQGTGLPIVGVMPGSTTSALARRLRMLSIKRQPSALALRPSGATGGQ